MNSRYNGSRSTSGYISFFYSFSEFLLHVCKEIITLPKIGLYYILKRNRLTTIYNYFNYRTANHFIKYLRNYII